MMTDRENIIGLFRRTGFERLMPEYSMVPDLQKRFDAYCRQTGYEPPAPAFVSIPGVPVDVPRSADFWQQFYDRPFKDGTYFDEYGVAWEPGSEACFHMRHMVHPLEPAGSLEELERYPYPTYAGEPTREMLEAVARGHAQGKFCMGGMQCTVWETAWYTRGMEALMMDMLEEPELADCVLDKVTENAVHRAQAFARAGVDGLYLGDDVGMQHTGMMSLPLYRRFLKPRLKRVIDAARAIRPDLIVLYHSCGYVRPYIDDLIEVGVDVLNPVQPESMEFRELYETYRGRLSFCGVLGTQTLMPFGTAQEVREATFAAMDFVGPQGGLLACPTHVMEPEVPLENVIAYLEACRDYKVR